jgi:hypothetical protein
LRVEKYRNPLVTEGEFVSPMIKKKTKILFKLLISVVHDRRNEFSGNSHAEINPPW